MFPNVRLIIVAMFASILGICSGLGLFAAFRVSHEPIERLASGGQSLQIAANQASFNQVAFNDAGAASFGVRFEVRAPPSGAGEGTAAMIPYAAAAQAPASEPPAAPAQDGLVAPLPVATLPFATSDAGDAADRRLTEEPARQNNAPGPQSEMVDIAVATPATEPPPGAQASLGDQTVPDRSAKSDGKPAATAVSAKPVRGAEKRRRLAKPRHVHAPVVATAPATNQNFAWPQSGAQSAFQPAAPTPAAVRRRVVLKRRHPTKQAVAQTPARPQTVAGAAPEVTVAH